MWLRWRRLPMQRADWLCPAAIVVRLQVDVCHLLLCEDPTCRNQRRAASVGRSNPILEDSING